MKSTNKIDPFKPLVLVIEDELVVALSIKKSLEKIGYSCICAASRHVLSQKLKHIKPDLIISETDWIARLSLSTFLLNKNLQGKMPIIGLTSSTDIKLSNNLVYQTITKPFDIENLVSAVQKVLQIQKRA